MSAAPAFPGFPEGGLQFFRDLARNNNREWFEAHKVEYQELLIAPAQAFVEALGPRLQAIIPSIAFDTRANGGSITRIYRDIRFSKDKTPYKDYLGINFWHEGQKRLEGSGFYVHLTASGVDVYTGMHHFDKPFLDAYREAVVDKKLGAQLDDALASIQKSGAYPLGGDMSKRVPAGYAADHPRADLLRYKGLHAQSPHLDPQVVSSPELVDVCFEHCRHMAPLHHWLVAVEARTTRE